MAATVRSLRDLTGTLPAGVRVEASESLDDLEHEMRSQVPKQSRIKSFLGSLWSRGREVAQFTDHLTKIANAYGIDTTIFR